MNGLDVLDFVLEEMQGRILTASSMSGFVAAERAANSLEMDLVSRQAAELAVLFPKARLDPAEEAFGISVAEIASALRRTSVYSKFAMEAMTLYGRSANDRIRCDAAITARQGNCTGLSARSRISS